MIRESRIRWLVPALVLAGIWALHCHAIGFVVDDGYISFHYAQQLLAGNGLVYNVGERVEGYTNFLWIVTLAGVWWLLPGLDLLPIAQTLCIGLGGATIVLVAWAARSLLGARGAWCLLAPAMLAADGASAAWATSGLETIVFACVVTAASLAYLSALTARRGFVLAALLWACACMTRPDALLLFAIASVHLTVREWRIGATLRSAVLPWSIAFLALYGSYYAWRWTYYGYPFPNTFYVKQGDPSLVPHGIAYVRSYLVAHGVFPFVPVLWRLAVARDERRDVLALLTGGYLAYVVWVGGDGLGHSRFMNQVAPLGFLLVGDAWQALYERAAAPLPSLRARLLPVALTIGVAAVLVLGAQRTMLVVLRVESRRWLEPQSGLIFPGRGQSEHAYTFFDNYFVERQARAARWLDVNLPRGSLVAANPAGSTAYHMKHRVLDMLGLNDLHIARTQPGDVGHFRPGHMKGDGVYVLSRRPTAILMGNVAVLTEPLSAANLPQKLVRKSEHELWADAHFHAEYDLVVVPMDGEGPFRFFSFFLRKEVPLPEIALAAGVTRTPSPGAL